MGSQQQTNQQRGDTVNDTSIFWALVVNNGLMALGLPIVAGLFWYKRKQMCAMPPAAHGVARSDRRLQRADRESECEIGEPRPVDEEGDCGMRES